MDEAMEELVVDGDDYPFTQFVVCIGFMLVLVIENIVLSYKPAEYEEPLEPIVPLYRNDSTLSLPMGSTAGKHS